MKWVLIGLTLISFSQLFPPLLGQSGHSLPEFEDSSSNSANPAAGILSNILNSVPNANTRGATINEIFPRTSLELPRIPPPEIVSHPALLRDSDIARAKRQLLYSPHSDWIELLKENVEPLIIQPMPTLSRLLLHDAERLKNLAILYRIYGRSDYLETATQLLAQVPEPPTIVNLEGGSNSIGWGDFLLSAQALMPLSVTVDLLYNDLDPVLRDELRRKMTTVAGQLNDALIYTTANNHATVMALAILTFVMMEDSPQTFIPRSRNSLWQSAFNYLSRSLALIAPDGGYAEGVYYANFITNYLAPFSIYFRNATGIPLYEHPYLQRMVSWMLANRRGSGTYAAFDDAFQRQHFFLPLITSQGRQTRNWQAHLGQSDPITRAVPNLAEALLVYLPRNLAGESTEGAVQFYAESGQGVFRDRPINPDFFVSVLSEREFWFAARHEHIDPMSIELSAFGKDFLVDAGYGSGTGDRNRSWYLDGRASNGILVDNLGLNRNPLNGDPNASDWICAYDAENHALIKLTHSISDVTLERTALFVKNDYFLVLDSHQANRAHDIALNFNYLGSLKQDASTQLTIQQEDVSLAVQSLSTGHTPLIVSHNSALFTPPGKPQATKSFQIEAQSSRSGHILTVFFPSATVDQPSLAPISLLGDGEAFELPVTARGHNSVFGINRGTEIETPDWKTDAAAFWLKTDATGQLTGLMLVDMTNFLHQDLKISADFPCTLVLEGSDGSWQGFLDIDAQQSLSLSISGNLLPNLRHNRVVVTEAGESAYRLTGPGLLEIGPQSRPVRLPQRHHDEPDYLYSAQSGAFSPGTSEKYSNYQTQVAENQTARALVDGVDQAIDYWHERAFGNGELPAQLFHSLHSIAEASYDRDAASTYSISVPTRFTYSGTVAGTEFAFFEEGELSADGLDIFNLGTRVRARNGSAFSYQAGRWFEDHQSHRLRFSTSGGNLASVQLNSLENLDSQHIILRQRFGGLMLQPEVYSGYTEEDSYQLIVVGNHWASATLLHSGAEQGGSSQSLRMTRPAWSIAIRGEQIDSLNSQHYLIDSQLRLTDRLRIASSAAADVYESPSLSRWRFQPLYQKENLRMSAAYEWLDSTHVEQASIYWRTQRHRVSAIGSLTGLDLEKHDHLSLRWHTRTAGSIRSDHLASYRHDYAVGEFRFRTQHQMSGISWLGQLSPIIVAEWHDPLRLSRIGAGWHSQSVQNLYAHALIDRAHLFTNVSYQLAGDITIPGINLIHIWMNAVQTDGKIQYGELGVSPLYAGYGSGLYFSYERSGDRRFEGYLRFRW